MFRPARRAAILLGLLAAATVAACDSAPATSGQAGASAGAGTATGFIVVTTGGIALVDAATDVPPTLDLRIRAGRALTADETSASLDGRRLGLTPAEGALVASVVPMPLSSTHRLDLTLPGRDPQSISFHVVDPSAAHAALHGDGTAAVLDVAFALPPDHAPVEAGLPLGGALQWSDQAHLRVSWRAAPGGVLDLPASIPTARGSHLAGDLRLDLTTLPAAGTLASADVPGSGPQPLAPLVVAFSVGTAASRSSAQLHAGQISVLSPTGMRVLADGSIEGDPDAAAATAARAGAVALMPVVQQLDAATAAALATSPAAPAELTASLRARAKAGSWGGVQLDVENIPAEARDGFSALVATLAGGLHLDGRRLAVDVVPHRPGHLTAASAGYDLAAIGKAADWVVLMAYEEHNSSSDPGPVAGRGWQEEMLAGSLGDLGGGAHALLGVPLYARTWAGAGASSTADAYAAAVSDALSVPGARADYDFAAATPFIATPGGALTYFDDAASLARKLALVPEHGMAGLAMWRLGFEDPALWSRLPAAAARP